MISVVLATYNEAQNIERCLQAVQDFADELIVVDGSSTDNTVALAKKLGAQVFVTTNKANFHINKQLAMDKAKGELVLQLDADEVVDQELAEFIQHTHQQLAEHNFQPLSATAPVAWYLKRKNLFMGQWLKKGGQYPDPVIRLYLNGYAHLPQQDVHEQMQVDGVVAWAKGHLLHYANPQFSDYLRKFATYTSFKAQQLYDQDTQLSFVNASKYLLWLPVKTFLLLFIRHKGFVDGIPGFVFALFSGLHHHVAFLKLWELYENKQKT
ncbi:MAG: glycosyltransferase [Candidatus Pacebacteria bacterium]|nr:glycosyltransferase [Candidatus Paceibacterota bacterium]